MEGFDLNFKYIPPPSDFDEFPVISLPVISVEEAERGYQIALKRFNSGLGTQLEVTDALGALISSQVNYLQSVFDYKLNHARIDQIMGKDLEEINFNKN